MLQNPVVANLVEAGFDVAFKHPNGRTFSRQQRVTLLESIGAAAAFAEPIGVLVAKSFHDGCERKRVKGLHGAVVQGGDS